MAEVCVGKHYERRKSYFGGKWEKQGKKVGGESGGRESHGREVKVGLLWRSMWNNFVRWLTILLAANGRRSSLGRGTGYFFRRKKYWRQMGGRQREGAQNFGNPWDVNVSEGGMLEKILGRGGSGEVKLYRGILGSKGTLGSADNRINIDWDETTPCFSK